MSISLNRLLRAERAQANKVSRVKTARITHFNFALCAFFTPSSTHGVDSQRFATTVSAKVTAQKKSNWAGATHHKRVAPAPLGVLRAAKLVVALCATACPFGTYSIAKVTARVTDMVICVSHAPVTLSLCK